MDFLNAISLCGVAGALFYVLAQGPIISAIVNALKKIEYVAKNPLVVVAALNLLVTLTTNVMVCGTDIGKLLEQLLAGFAGSVASYEVAKSLGIVQKPEDKDIPL